MANLDTAAKRFSGINVMMPWRGIASIPDGTIAAGDRQALAYLYSGILATTPTPVSTETPSGRWQPLRKKKPIRITRSQYAKQQEYEEAVKAAMALAAASTPVSRITETGVVIGHDEVEDDEILLLALLKVLH